MGTEKTKSKIRINKKAVYSVIIILIILIGAVFYVQRPKMVSYTVPKIQTYQSTVLASGEINPDELITIKAQVGGEILEMEAQEGESISKNQNILKLDSEKLQKTLSEKAAAVAVAQSNYDATVTTNYNLAKQEAARLEIQSKNLENDYNKKSLLFESGGISQKELEDAKEDVDKNKVDLETARIKIQSYAPGGSEAKKQSSFVYQASTILESSRQDISKYKINSPLAGIIIKKYVSEGEIIEPGSPIIDVAKTSRRYAEIKVDEKNIGYVKKGQEAYVYPSSNPEIKIRSSISYISPFIDKESGTILAKIEIPKASEQAFPISLTVTVELVKESYPESTVIDSNYIIQENDQAYIFIEQKARALKIPVDVTGSGAEVRIEYKQDKTGNADADIKESTRILSPQGLKDGTRVSTKEGGGK
ncbi:MAG: efflux RND transporter periplasmic adaptor subunit [Proteocatella sp.]